MQANVTIWKIDRSNLMNLIPMYSDACGTYSNKAVDDTMIKALLYTFASARPAVNVVARFPFGTTNVTWAFASDGVQGTELYLVRVIEL